MTQPLDILAYIRDLLQVLILPIIEDGIIYDYPIYGVIRISSQDLVLQFFAVNLAQLELEATGRRSG